MSLFKVKLRMFFLFVVCERSYVYFPLANSLFIISLISRSVVGFITISFVVERVVSSAYIIKSKYVYA